MDVLEIAAYLNDVSEISIITKPAKNIILLFLLYLKLFLGNTIKKLHTRAMIGM